VGPRTRSECSIFLMILKENKQLIMIESHLLFFLLKLKTSLISESYIKSGIMYCANCETTLDEEIESDSFEVEDEDAEIPKVVTILEAASLIFNKNEQFQVIQNCFRLCNKGINHMGIINFSSPSFQILPLSTSLPLVLRMCQNCILVLSELYLVFTQFKRLSTKTSHLQQLLGNAPSSFTSNEQVKVTGNESVDDSSTITNP